MKRKQRGDAGATMLVVMVVMLAGIFWWGGMHGGGDRGHMSGATGTMTREKSVLEQFDEAYAQGKIGREEYLRKREDLMGR